MASISETIKDYLRHSRYPFHMPGHKRNETLCPDGSGVRYDFTEIDGFDNLYNAQEMIAESEEKAAELFGADRTFFLVNGSTVGIMAAIMAAGEMDPEKRSLFIIGADCHKSVYNALKLGKLTGITADGKSAEKEEALTTLAQMERELDWQSLPERIACTLENHRDAVSAVVITSPSYEGIMSDVRRIAQIAHENGAILIVDEAHGTHLGMQPYFPENSNRLGADIVIQSMHKTMTGLTQTALLHVNGDRVDDRRIMHYLEMLQTSSPSYLLMNSIDACVALLKEHGEELFDAYVKRLKHFRAEAANLRHIKLFEMEHYDRGKIVLTVNHEAQENAASGEDALTSSGEKGANSVFSIQDVYCALRDDYQIQLEMLGNDYALAMTSFADTDEGFDRLLAALKDIDQGGCKRAGVEKLTHKEDCYRNHA